VFSERRVDAPGGSIRYLEAGQGAALVHLPTDLRLTPAHDLLARRFRVMVFEPPAPDAPASMLAATLDRVGLDAFNLMGTSQASGAALGLALHAPERVLALVLESPTAIDPRRRDAETDKRLASVAVPTLVLFGTADDVAPPEAGRVYKALIPNGHLVFVYAAGHAVSADRPEAFAEVVTDFLERHEAFVISRTTTVIHP
jgi:pimeloyl-ACP methyl ester carboxylesterase